jgi:hypothetical protein
MGLAILFNSTFLVLWAVVLIPHALANEKKWLIGLSGAVLLPIEIYLSWDLQEYPLNLLAGIFSFSLGLAGGYVTHFLDSKKLGEKT